jgi:hypothetical protein
MPPCLLYLMNRTTRRCFSSWGTVHVKKIYAPPCLGEALRRVTLVKNAAIFGKVHLLHKPVFPTVYI